MGKQDIISTQVIRHLAADMANHLLGLDIDAGSVELIETEQQRHDRNLRLVGGCTPDHICFLPRRLSDYGGS